MGQNGKKPPPKNSCFKETLYLDSWVCVDLCLYLATIGSSDTSQFFFPLVKLRHFPKEKLDFFWIFFFPLVQI
jgi:hypothetical protein